MSYEYDYIDNNDFIKKRTHRDKLMYTEFDRLLKTKDEFTKRFLYQAFCISNGNIVKMAKGLKLSRGAVYKYLRETFGNDFKHVLITYHEQSELEIS